MFLGTILPTVPIAGLDAEEFMISLKEYRK
jgi:hypothetical protein